MNNQSEYRILPLEVSVSLISFIIGVGILTIPRTLAQELETPDGWISIAISGTIIMILVALYTRLQRHFPGQNLLQYIGQGSVGKWGAKCLAILFIIYFITLCSFEVRTLTFVVKMYLLDQTPSEVIAASILLLSTTMCHFLAYFILKDEYLTGKNDSIKKRGLILPSVVQFVIFIVTFIPNNIAESFTFSDWIGWLGASLFVMGLLIGYLTLWIRKQVDKKEKDTLKG